MSKFHPVSITLLLCTRREKIDLADSEKRTPEVKFRLFYFIVIPEILSGNTASVGTVKITAHFVGTTKNDRTDSLG